MEHHRRLREIPLSLSLCRDDGWVLALSREVASSLSLLAMTGVKWKSKKSKFKSGTNPHPVIAREYLRMQICTKQSSLTAGQVTHSRQAIPQHVISSAARNLLSSVTSVQSWSTIANFGRSLCRYRSVGMTGEFGLYFARLLRRYRFSQWRELIKK